MRELESQLREKGVIGCDSSGSSITYDIKNLRNGRQDWEERRMCISLCPLWLVRLLGSGFKKKRPILNTGWIWANNMIIMMIDHNQR